MEIKNFVPPIGIDLALFLTKKRHGFTGRYESFSDAEIESTTYESDVIVDLYSRQLLNSLTKLNSDKKLQISDRSMRLLAMAQLAMNKLDIKNTSILDFGGAYGNHFFDSLEPLHSNIRRYVVCESPKVVSKLSKTHSPIEFKDNVFEFTENEFEIAIASCSLPYLKTPYEHLQQILKVSKFLILDRMPLVSDLEKDIVVLQNTQTSSGQSVSYPAWFFSESQMQSKIAEFGGEIILTWSVPEDRPFFNGKRRPYVGYIIKAR